MRAFNKQWRRNTAFRAFKRPGRRRALRLICVTAGLVPSSFLRITTRIKLWLGNKGGTKEGRDKSLGAVSRGTPRAGKSNYERRGDLRNKLYQKWSEQDRNK